jgi:hypothetical protein
MARWERRPHDPAMFRRIVALTLWTYFAWYLGAMLAAFTGGPTALGPMLASLTAAVCVTGWARSNRRRAPSPANLEPSVSR